MSYSSANAMKSFCGRGDTMDIETIELLQKIVDEAPLGMYVLDTERKIVFWSIGAERITGYSKEEMVGRHCFEGMLDHIDREGVHLCHDFCPMMATIFDGQSREQPVFLKDRTGRRIPVMVHTEPLFKGQETLGAIEYFWLLPACEYPVPEEWRRP